MAKFAIGETVDNAADDHEVFFNEEKLVVHPC
jgi:hypothetical protein